MELKVVDMSGQDVGTVEVNEQIFGRAYNESLVHQLVTAFLANARSGNRAQKTRSQVNKSTRKPWRQKGTGRARAGMASSPLWRGGGKIFPNTPDENFTQKVNRKMYRSGMASILSRLVLDGRLVVVDSLSFGSPKTKEFVKTTKALNLDNALFVTNVLDENVYLSSRNLPDFFVLESHQIDPYSLLRFNKVVMTRESIEAIQERWV
jgi:large subunit ribosomal protein L4